ncbi:MAG: NFACT RNA binding domain-containing protein [Nitrospinota bacterium]
MDSFVLKAIAGELDTFLRGATVQKILQPNKATIVLEINPPPSARSSGGIFDSLPRSPKKANFRLLISVDHNLPRVHLTSAELETSKTPPPFCMLLRKHLTGARMVKVTLRGIERILNLNFEKRDPVGRILRYTLVAEIMGRHSNLFLVDSRTGVILDALKMVPPGKSSKRPIRRNVPYELPPAQEKLDPLTVGEEAFLSLAEGAEKNSRGGKLSSRWLVESFAGISPDLASYVFGTAKGSGLWEALRDTRDRFLTGEFSPGILTVEEGDEGTVWVLPPPAGKRFVSFPSANTAADELYGRSWGTRRLDAKRSAVQKELDALLRRKRRTAEQVRQDLTRTADADGQQRKGEILLANLGSIPKGAESMRLRDPATDAEVDIALDRKLTPPRNAQRYFSRAKKLRRMAVLGGKRLKEIEGQVSRLEALAGDVKSAAQIKALEGIEAKLSVISAKAAAAPVGGRTANGRGRPAPPPARKREGEVKAAKTQRAKKAEKREKISGVAAESGAGRQRTRSSGANQRPRGKPSTPKTASKAREAASRAATEKPAANRPTALSQRRKSSDYRCFLLESGWEILVGKHDKGNDRLLRRVAGAEDVWLHAQGVPGSHVIIHHPERGKEVPLRVLEEAAKLAAFYSKGKGAAKVPVDYTVVKHLRRPKGGKSGQVTYKGQRTILVPPESPEGLHEADSLQENEAKKGVV